MTLSAEEKREHGQALIAALNARDFDAIANSPYFGEHAEFRSAIALSEGEVYRGVQGLRDWAANVDATWDDFHIEILEHRDLPPDRSLTVFRVTGRAKTSGVPLDMPTAQIWTWEDGKMVRNDSFTDLRDAFEAAGLPYDPSTRST